MKELIETAIKMENDSIAFYEEAAAKTRHPFGREMFKGFVKDEKRHLSILQNIFKESGVEAAFIRPKETIRTIFNDLKDEMMQRVDALQDEIDAIKIALKFEKEGYDFYMNATSKATTEKEKELLEKLAHEENEHFEILNETYNFLDNTGQWYMYEEGGILEG